MQISYVQKKKYGYYKKTKRKASGSEHATIKHVCSEGPHCSLYTELGSILVGAFDNNIVDGLKPSWFTVISEGTLILSGYTHSLLQITQLFDYLD